MAGPLEVLGEAGEAGVLRWDWLRRESERVEVWNSLDWCCWCGWPSWGEGGEEALVV